jgi:ribosomal protein S18 acetylase RimI-like enzyme
MKRVGSVAKALERLTNKAEIRRRLLANPDWSLYALADLDEALFPECDWYGAGEGLALVFRALPSRPIFVTGTPAEARGLLAGLPEREGYLNLRDEHLAAAEGLWRYRAWTRMRRMLLGEPMLRPGPAVVLTRDDLPEVEALFATGDDAAGVMFAPFQLETGFFGLREGRALVAVAAAQVASRAEGVAAIGNVFTRPDRRGRGLAQVAISAAVSALRKAGIRTVGLNIAENNVPAVAAYERLGFTSRLNYVEGAAIRDSQDS